MLFVQLRARDLANGAAQLLRVGKVDSLNGGDRLRGNRVGIKLRVQRDARQDAQLGARVEAIHIG